MAQRQQVNWRTLSGSYGYASWCVNDGMVTVRVPNGNISAPLAGLSPESLAHLLMYKLRNECAE